MDEIIVCDDCFFDDGGRLCLYLDGVTTAYDDGQKTVLCYGSKVHTLFDGVMAVEFGNGFYLC